MPLMIREFGIHDVVQISLLSVVPNAIGAAGLIAIARRSDRRRERRWHFAACALGGAVALALLTLHLSSIVAMMALLSVAAMLIFAAHPVFWAVPSAYFSGAGAAGGIALISSIGVSSGMITPWLVGLIRTRTGSMDPAMLMIAAFWRHARSRCCWACGRCRVRNRRDAGAAVRFGGAVQLKYINSPGRTISPCSASAQLIVPPRACWSIDRQAIAAMTPMTDRPAAQKSAVMKREGPCTDRPSNWRTRSRTAAPAAR